MSTILRALKKLEQDKETIGARGMSGMAPAATERDERPAGRSWMSKRALRAAVIGAVFIGIFFVAVYYYIQSGPSSTQPVQPPETDQKATQPRRIAAAPRTMDRSESVARHSRQPPRQAGPAPQRKPPPERQPQSTIAGTGAPSTPALQERIKSGDRPVPGLDSQRTSPPGAAIAPETTAGAAKRVTSPAATSQPAKPVPPAGTKSEQDSAYAAADRLTDNRLKIQAIVWSSIPDERMAVINTHIVREGGSVEGFSVVAIRSDDVIVRENGRLYRVAFGKP